MNKYSFKEAYYSANGMNLPSVYSTSTSYYTYLGDGDGSKSNPGNAASISITSPASGAVIIGGGRMRSNITIYRNAGSNPMHILGQGIGYTTLTGTFEGKGYQGNNFYNYYKDITFEEIVLRSTTTWNSSGAFEFNWCEFKKTPSYGGNYGNLSFKDNIFHFIPTTPLRNITGKNTFLYAQGAPLNLSEQLYHKCYIDLSQATITNLQNRYIAFNDCLFKIGDDEEYTPLEGNTAVELRENFVARCNKWGIVPNDITVSEETLPQGYWLFTKGSVIGNIPYKGSEIHHFEETRSTPITFGLYADRFERIAITTRKDEPKTFIKDYASEDLLFKENSISLSEKIDITDSKKLIAVSKINNLGGFRQINKIYVPDSFQKEYGILLDSTNSIDRENPIYPGENKIEAGELYFIRSSNKEEASISYNEETYTTDILSNNNHFQGVEGLDSFSKVTGEPVVYKLRDRLQYYTIQMRIVNEIPSEKIISGNLLPNYWYLIGCDNNESSTEDYITYNGTNYFSGDSFLVKEENVEFDRTGDIYLKRCWKNDFDENDEQDIDHIFWKNKQKPKWFDIVPNDPRCLGVGNTYLYNEMQTGDDGNYITSGHPQFYSSINGVRGFQMPAYQIKGAFQQFRLVINTQSLINVI